MVMPSAAPRPSADELPVPTLWLLGRAQSGKSSIVRALTGCDGIVIGNGFSPCTRDTKAFEFPPGVSPALRFLDTRGLDETDYDPTVDIEACGRMAHMIIVVMRIMDRNQDKVISIVDRLLHGNPYRPVLHVLTCLHEAYPGANHPDPYPFAGPPPWCSRHLNLAEFNQLARFQIEAMGHRASRTVLVDITEPENGLSPHDYGVDSLKENILDLLPAKLRNGIPQNMCGVDGAIDTVIHRHAWIAAAAGGVPIPGMDLVGVTAVQARMVSELAKLIKAENMPSSFLNMVGPIVIATAGRRAAASLVKLIPWVGSMVGAISGAAINGVSTVALGKVFVWYCRTTRLGAQPTMEEVGVEYRRRFAEAAKTWSGEA